MSFPTFKPPAVSQRMAALLPEIFPEPAPLLPLQERFNPAFNGLTLGERLLLAILDRVWASCATNTYPGKAKVVQAQQEAHRTVTSLMSARYDRPIVLPTWGALSEKVQAVYSQVALTMLGPQRRFAFTFMPERPWPSLNGRRAMIMRGTLADYLDHAIGRPTRSWIILEPSFGGRFRIHGAVDYYGLSVRPIRDALDSLPGIVEGMELPSGFAPEMASTCALLSSRPVLRYKSAFASSNDVRALARELFETDVWRLRESELCVLPKTVAKSKRLPTIH